MKRSHQIAADLRARITKGELPEGGRLPTEAELLEIYQVSRPTLREALRILESEGLLTLGRGVRDGALVSRPTAKRTTDYATLMLTVSGVTLRDIHEARSLFEPKLVEDLAARRTAQTVADLAQLQAEMARQARPKTLSASVLLSSRFHNRLAQLGSNPATLLFSAILEAVAEGGDLEPTGKAPPLALLRASLDRSTKAYQTLCELTARGTPGQAHDFWQAYMNEGQQFLAETGLGEQVIKVSPRLVRQFQGPEEPTPVHEPIGGDLAPATRSGETITSRPFRDSVTKVILPKLSHVIANQLRAQILSRELAEGSKLPSEPELVNIFGVSRSTLREALRILEVEGLLVIGRGPRSGARVARPHFDHVGLYAANFLNSTGATLTDLHHARLLFEPGLVGLLASKPAEAGVTHTLRGQIDAMRAELQADDYAGVVARTRDFHAELANSSGNRAIALFITLLQAITQQPYLSLVASHGASANLRPRMERIVGAYDVLCSLIERGKSKEASAFWIVYLQRSAEMLGNLSLLLPLSA